MPELENKIAAPEGCAPRLVSGFDAFWIITLERWKKTPAKERNFLKRIGLEPNKETSYEAYIAIKSTPPQQLNLFL